MSNPRLPRVWSVPDCNAEFYALGLCKQHYDRVRRRGDISASGYPARKCEAPGCDKTIRLRSDNRPRLLCHKHHQKFSRSQTFDRLVGGEEWRRKLSEARRSAVSRRDATRNPSGRGYLAATVINDVKMKALKRGKEWSLSSDEAYDLITGACHYCGAPAEWPRTRNGIDRVDNAAGYVPGNCVSCCATCNSAKGTMSVAEFREWARRLYEHLTNREQAAPLMAVAR